MFVLCSLALILLHVLMFTLCQVMCVYTYVPCIVLLCAPPSTPFSMFTTHSHISEALNASLLVAMFPCFHALFPMFLCLVQCMLINLRSSQRAFFTIARLVPDAFSIKSEQTWIHPSVSVQNQMPCSYHPCFLVSNRSYSSCYTSLDRRKSC